ncbi:hypothetical protein FBR02_02745 [Anaerolineae bacterium CFX9]|nr:hypothetical protein [Anaerolineae bacterium CFX9]
MDARVEKTLVAVARRYAPALIPIGWAQPGDYALLTGSPNPHAELAFRLANEGVLVIVGDLSAALAHQAGVLFRDWGEAYTSLYSTLTRTLFPSYTDIQAFYADQEFPPIVGMIGAAPPVIMAMAGYVAPFIAARRRASAYPTSDVELRGLMDEILEYLEAADLPREAYRQLRDACIVHLRTLLTSPVRQLELTPALDPSVTVVDMPSEPPSPPESLPPIPPPPADLPEAARPLPPDVLPEMLADITSRPPLFFDARESGAPRRPPVPDLPEMPSDPPSKREPR